MFETDDTANKADSMISSYGLQFNSSLHFCYHLKKQSSRFPLWAIENSSTVKHMKLLLNTRLLLKIGVLLLVTVIAVNNDPTNDRMQTIYDSKECYCSDTNESSTLKSLLLWRDEQITKITKIKKWAKGKDLLLRETHCSLIKFASGIKVIPATSSKVQWEADLTAHSATRVPQLPFLDADIHQVLDTFR